MYSLSPDEMLLIARIFAYVMGDSSVKLTELDKDATKCLIKNGGSAGGIGFRNCENS